MDVGNAASTQVAAAASRSLIAAVRSYASGVDMLKGPLEADVLEASEACWKMDERTVQVKSKLLVSFRARQVKVTVPEFIAEAEQQLLGAALKQWHSSAEGVVVSSVLEVRVAEQRLLHAVYRLVQHASSDGNTMLELLDSMLTASAQFHDALAVRCTSAHQTIRRLALYAGMKFMEPSVGQDDSRLSAWSQLIRVLQRHTNQTSWAAALLQVPISQLPGVLPTVLCTDCEGSAGTEQGIETEQVAACKALFAQLPWEEVTELGADSIREGVRLPLLQHLTTIAGQASQSSSSDAADLVHSIMTVLLLIAFKVPELKVETHGAIQVAILAIATGGSLQAVLDMLGGSFDGVVDANLLPWAQLAWGAAGAQADTAVAASLVQRLDWQEMAFSMPGKLGTRVLLTLTATAGAVLNSNISHVKQQYITWLWSLLLSSAGKALVQVDASDLEDVQELCLAEACDRTDAVSAIWGWIQMHLAVGLLEHWARLDDSSQSSQQAQTLLESMRFFSVAHTLLDYGQGEAVVTVMMRFVEAAAALGEPFFRQNVDGVAAALGPSLQAVEQGGSVTGVLPIQQNLQRLIKRGIAVNEATKTPSKATPDSSPPESPRTPPPPKRGSTTSPGQEALATGSRWLAALVCCHHRAGLAADGLSLVNDLVQLLYYHGSGVAHSLTLEDCDTTVHLLSPVVQECMETAVGAVGTEGVQELWGSLMQKEAANARQLQWLAVLACWLSNTVSAAAAAGSPVAKQAQPSSDSPLPIEHEGEAAPPSPGKEQSDTVSKPAEADELVSRPAADSPAVSSMQSTPEKAEQSLPPAETPEAAVPTYYPPPPGTPPATCTTQDTPPPPAYDQAMQQSTKHGRPAHASHAADTTHETGQGSLGSSPSGSPGGKCQMGTGVRSGATGGTEIAGGDQLHSTHLEAISRSAEEALQIQEAAVGIGYGAAALPLWEEFVIRFFKYETQLGAVVPKQQIANHLQQLAVLYETNGPVLSDIYALLSCLSPDQLPGGTPRFVAENKQALRSLMQLHPLNITKADGATMSQPPSPNPLVDTNPFGAVPLSALVQTPTPSTKKKQTAGALADGGHFAAALEETAAHTPQGRGHGEDEDVQSVPQAFIFQRQAAVPAASFQDLITQQESMTEDVETSRAALRPWARRAEKQAARARSTSPRRSGSRRTPSADLGAQGGLAHQISTGSAGGSGERAIHSYLARSSRDGDVPELISQAQGKLWEMTSAWTEELERIHAAMRELVCRRYRHVDLNKIASGEVGDVDEVHFQEDPMYREHLSALRGEALKVVMDFTANAGLLQVAQLLYQLEVMLLQSSLSNTEVHKEEQEVEVECKCQLLLVLAEVTLDGSTPLICSPFFATLFCQAASGAVPISPHTKVRLCRRILRALASNSQPQQQEREAVTLLKASLDPATLLTTSSLHDFEACLDTVLFHSHRLLPATVTTLLACFSLPVYASKLLEGEAPKRDLGAGEQSSGWAREESARAPSGVTKVLNLALATLSLKGGAATGGALAQGLLVTGPATYYAAVLQLAITGEEEEGRKAAVAALMQVPTQGMPLSVILDSLLQVAEAMNSNALVPPHIPQALLHNLLQAPALLAALRSMIAGAGASTSAAKQETRGSTLWSAKVGSTKAEGAGSSSSSRGVAPDSSGEPKQALLLLPVNVTATAGECVQHVVGAWLQSILRKFGSGLEPVAFTEEFTCLLSSLFEAAGSHPWLVDWLWSLYQAVLQPFLCLAGPASDGTAITRFREYWQSLPWHKATFHCISPDALQLMASFLLSPDRATLQLLHVLDWRPVLQQLAPVTAHLQSNLSGTTTAQQASLLDNDMSSSTSDAGLAPSQQSGVRSSQGGLDAGGKAWAAQLLLLVMQAYVIMADDDLPDWISRLIKGRSDRDLVAGNDDSGALWLTSSLRLPQVFAAAQLEALQRRLGRQGPSDTPFLLQAFVTAPNLVEGDPNPRLLTLARLLVQGAKLNGSAKAATVAANMIQDVMLVSVCRGFHTEEGTAGPAAEGRLEMLECWHLSADDMATLTKECLLPLAEMHASLGLAQSLQPEGALAVAPKPQQTEAGKQWHAPALSSLVHRLAQPAGKQPLPSTPSRSKPEEVEHYLDPSSDEEDQAAASAEPEQDASSVQSGLSIYSAAAGPFKALLACIAMAPGVLVTLEPLPFANAEGPLKVLASDPSSAGHTGPAGHLGAAQASAAQTELHAHSPAKGTAAPGKEGSMSSLKSRMAALKKGMGIGSTDVKGTKLPHTAAATDATSIQLRLALILHESTQQRRPEFALSLLRVIFATHLMPESPLLCALTEDIVLGLLLRQQGSSRPEPSGSHAGPARQGQGAQAASLHTGSKHGLDRQGSYTEMALATPIVTDTDLVTPLETTVAASHGTTDQAIAPLSTCLEDLPQGILMGLCQAGAAHRMPLTVALVSERARQQAAALDSLAWRDLVADVVEVTAKAQAHPVAHLHLLAPCLQALLWLADARWRKLGSAAPVDQVQHLLDCLQGHVALLWAAFPPAPTSHDSSLFAGAAERLRLARSEVKARLSRGESGSLPSTPSTPSETAPTPLARPSGRLGAFSNEGDASGVKPKAGLLGVLTRGKEADAQQASLPAPQSRTGRFANLRAKLGRPSEQSEEAQSEVEPESRLGSKLAGFKNRLLKTSSNPASRAPSGSMDPYMLTQAAAAPPAAHSGPSPSPLDFAYDFGALAQDRQEARQGTAGEHASASETAGAPRVPVGEAGKVAAAGARAPLHPQQGMGVKGNLTDRMAGNLRKAMGIGSKEADPATHTHPGSEGPHMAAQAAAAAVLVPMGLAAFAISAYIRSTLCPSLQGYSPQPVSSVSTADLQQMAAMGSEASSSDTAQQHYLLKHMHRSAAALSAAQHVAPFNAVQIQQLQPDLNSLEEVCTQSCLVAPHNTNCHDNYLCLQGLLAKGSSVEQFQRDLQALLFPSMPFLQPLQLN